MGVRVNDAFLLGGVEKANVLEILKPHIFLDDRKRHLANAARVAPSAHVPFGVISQDHDVTPADAQEPSA